MKKIVLLAGLLLTLTGCSIYHPQAVDIPLINHEGDTRVDASVALSYWIIPSTFTLNTTVSHGFNGWLAGQVHANFGGNNYYLQAAPGAYLPLGEKSVLEGYVGLGYGGAWNDNVEATSESANSHNYSYSGTFMLPFVQGNIGWHDLTPLHIDLALGLKCGAYMPNYSYYELDASDQQIAGTDYDYTTTNFLFEPQLMFRVGGEHMKFNVKLGVSFLSDVANGHSSSQNFYYDFVSGSAGLTFFF